jgi:hypothetical protein
MNASTRCLTAAGAIVAFLKGSETARSTRRRRSDGKEEDVMITSLDRCRFVPPSALTWLLCASTAAAQVTTADVVGRVTDTSGAALPRTAVTITNVGTGAARTVVTNESGDYVVSLLPIGGYTLRIEREGFTPFVATLTLAAGDRQRVDAQMKTHRTSLLRLLWPQGAPFAGQGRHLRRPGRRGHDLPPAGEEAA